MILLETTPQGIVLPVKAQAGARTNGLRGEQSGMLKVAVTQAAEKGKANTAILELLADQLHLRRSQIQLLSGHTSAQKKFLIRDCELAELEQKIAVVLSA